MQAVIFIGIQASGKSTFYQERFRDTHVRINLDMLKTRRREALLLRACLDMKQPFVVDNTNPAPEDRARYIPEAKAAGFRVIGYYFETTVEEALRRNARRSGKQRIPEKGVGGTHSRLTPPSWHEGFDMLYTVRITGAEGFEVTPWEKEESSSDHALAPQ